MSEENGWCGTGDNKNQLVNGIRLAIVRIRGVMIGKEREIEGTLSLENTTNPRGQLRAVPCFGILDAVVVPKWAEAGMHPRQVR